jgi:hypothetical protein
MIIVIGLSLRIPVLEMSILKLEVCSAREDKLQLNGTRARGRQTKGRQPKDRQTKDRNSKDRTTIGRQTKDRQVQKIDRYKRSK